jgi:hypothetical protein
VRRTSSPARLAAVSAAVAVAWFAPPGGISPAASEPKAPIASAVQVTTSSAVAVGEIEWLPSRGRECNRTGRYKNFCQGPRRVPRPHGSAAELAQRLGLGTIKAVSHLILRPPKHEWLQAAGPADPDRALRRGSSRPRRHKGVDIGAPDGTPLRAARSGLVAYSDNGVRGYGNLLVVVHGDGSVASYAHCRAIYVFPGQRVVRGQIVGEVGHTGIARGSHLHFEYRLKGRPRDPVRRFIERPDLRPRRKR